MIIEEIIAHLSWHDEAAEQVPEAVKEGADDAGNLVAWSKGYGHHAV